MPVGNFSFADSQILHHQRKLKKGKPPPGTWNMMSNCVSSGNAGQALPPKLCLSYVVNTLNKHILFWLLFLKIKPNKKDQTCFVLSLTSKWVESNHQWHRKLSVHWRLCMLDTLALFQDQCVIFLSVWWSGGMVSNQWTALLCCSGNTTAKVLKLGQRLG